MTFTTHFYGNEISPYGKKNGYVDYATLAKAFDAVLANDLMNITEAAGLGYWDQISGFIDHSEEIEELENRIEELEDLITENSTDEEDEITHIKIEDIRDQIAELEEEQSYLPEIYQFYIVSGYGAEILERYTNEIVFYNDTLNLYVWGVTHWGTSWDYVLTNIPCEKSEA